MCSRTVTRWVLTIALTSAISVTNRSWVSCWGPNFANTTSKTRLTMPICLSNTPPKWDGWGGGWVSISWKAFSNLDCQPRKLVHRSHLRTATGPQKARNLLNPHINELESILSSTSICMALELRQDPIVLHWMLFLWIFVCKQSMGRKHRIWLCEEWQGV
jgi:hypothetical protein